MGADVNREHFTKVYPEIAASRERDRAWWENQWKTILSKVHPRRIYGMRRGYLLDVGCGTGAFMRYAESRGWTAYGLDPLADISTERPVMDGLHSESPGIFKGVIEDPPDFGRQFELVTMFSVLEHLKHPNDALEAARKLIAPRGYLYVSVPNDYTWLQRRLSKRFGDWWEHETHLFYFNWFSLTWMLMRNGFERMSTGAQFSFLSSGLENWKDKESLGLDWKCQ